MSTRTETIEPGFDAHLALPPSGSGPGILLLQEIFGVNEYVRDAARRLAELGYVVLAPDFFWRTEPGLELGPDDLERAFGAIEKLDKALVVQDAIGSLAALRALPEVTGAAGRRAGTLGFCFGGSLAWHVAALGDPDCAVCYYGSWISETLELAPMIDCPVLLHFGGQDPYIPRELIDAVAAVAAPRDGFELHVQDDAGHAFDNSFSPQFSNPPAAAAAWEVTVEFLARTLPPD